MPGRRDWHAYRPRDGSYPHSSSNHDYRGRPPPNHHQHNSSRHHNSTTDSPSRYRGVDRYYEYSREYPSNHHAGYRSTRRHSPDRSRMRTRSRSRTPDRSRRRERRDSDSRSRNHDEYGTSSRARTRNNSHYRDHSRERSRSSAIDRDLPFDRHARHTYAEGSRPPASPAGERRTNSSTLSTQPHSSRSTTHSIWTDRRSAQTNGPPRESSSGSLRPSGPASRLTPPPPPPPAPPHTSSSQPDMRISDVSDIPLPPTYRILETRPRLYQTSEPRSVNVYKDLTIIGEGTFGQVYKAKDQFSGDHVALKRVRLENERDGFPITAVREIKILRQLNHKNIVNLIEIVTDKTNALEFRGDKGSFYLVFEYMEHDLMGLLLREVKFTENNIAHIMYQLLDGLSYCHRKDFLHRDIKCSNILVNNDGRVKLADFGLARLYSSEDQEPRPYTNKVITLWYRPPELLLGEEYYGKPVDIWSCGCILGELFTGDPMFRGATEIQQLHKIFAVCGTPTLGTWPDVPRPKDHAAYNIKEPIPRRLRAEYARLPELALDLLDNMLLLDPKKRISADAALEHKWFETIKFEPADLPRDCDWHEMSAKKERQRLRGG